MTLPLKNYWITWSFLLGLTLIMLVLDQMPMPRALFATVMLVAMLTKATLIAATFMHLRFERMSLVLMIVIGLFLNGAFLFGLIAPDAVRISGMQ